jgi:hypothetical protein
VWRADAPGEISLYYFDGETADQPAVVVGVVYEEGTETVIGHGLLVQEPCDRGRPAAGVAGGTDGWRFRIRNADGGELVRVDEGGQAFPRVPQMFVPGYLGPTVELADGARTVSEGYVVSTYTGGRITVRRTVTGTVDARYRILHVPSGTELVGWHVGSF